MAEKLEGTGRCLVGFLGARGGGGDPRAGLPGSLGGHGVGLLGERRRRQGGDPRARPVHGRERPGHLRPRHGVARLGRARWAERPLRGGRRHHERAGSEHDEGPATPAPLHGGRLPREDLLELLAEGLRRGRAHPGVRLDRAAHHLVERRRRGRCEGRPLPLLAVRDELEDGAPVRERMLARDELVEHDAERVDVGPFVGAAAGHLLGGHVGERPHETARLRERDRAEVLDATEVREPGRSLLVEEDVLRFQVAVDEAEAVTAFEGPRDRDRDRDRVRPGELPRVEPRAERTARHELHDVVGAAARDPRLVDRDDAGAAELGERLDLALEALEGGGARARRDDLESALDAGRDVARLVDDAHAPATELGLDLVGADPDGHSARLLDHP